MCDSASFGDWIRRRRRALDLTREALAQQVGCAVVTIRKIETDERRPSRQIAERLAECLQIPSDQRGAFLLAARADLVVDQRAASVPGRTAALGTEPPPTPPAVVASLSLPSGTVTFLFTDIEGSTQLWEQHPQAMSVAVIRYVAILRQAIEVHSGAIFKTIGDAVHAVFASPEDALIAVLFAQQGLQAADWGAVNSLRVRMALHIGAAQLRDNDYFGSPLNRIARLLVASHGGQVLLSQATAQLVREGLPPDTELRDLGIHRLRDLAQPEQIFQLVAPELPADFPPLKTLDRSLYRLPVQLTALIGREQEVATVCALLHRSDSRLVTLTGPGGVGKTRLALQAAAELAEEFGDGVWFVALAPVRDPVLVITAIAQTLGVREAGGQPLLESLKIYLRGKHILLLLDNFEHLLLAAPIVADLLASSSGPQVLVTSRAALRLSGEHEVVVPPLAAPPSKSGRRSTIDPVQGTAIGGQRSVIGQYPAVELFAQRAQSARLAFTITTANAPVVAEICCQLDGLPLAIELAAARVKLFPPEAILARLDNRLTMLTGGPRDRPTHQQTLRSTIDWSYALLDAAGQTLFARLGVFVGGCTLAAAEAVCNAAADLSIDVLNGIAALIDHSLLRREEQEDGESRFVMLETLREYALEQLERRGELEELRRAHVAYYLALAEAAELELRAVEQKVWLQRLEAEHDNLRAALMWSQDHTRGAEVGLRLVGALWRFWDIRGHINEGRLWLEQALARNTDMPALQAKVFTAAGTMAYFQGDYTQAAAFHEHALSLYCELGDEAGMAFALNNLGAQLFNLGNFARAATLREESLTMARKVGDESRIAYTLNSLGLMARAQGHYSRAVDLYQECLSLWRKLGHQRHIAVVLSNLAIVTRDQGDYAQAVVLFRESMRLTWDLEYKLLIAANLEELAVVAILQHEFERAARLFGAAEGLREMIDAPMSAVDRSEYQANVAAITAQLGDVSFVAAWAEGRAMPLEQAIAYACQGGIDEAV